MKNLLLSFLFIGFPFCGKALEGFVISGYNPELEKFQCAWTTSFYNGSAIMFSEGSKKDPDFSMLGSYFYVTPEIEQKWGWAQKLKW